MAFIQLIGTLLFNVDTVLAMVQTFTVEETNRLVWAPDVDSGTFIGVVCFLMGAYLLLPPDVESRLHDHRE